MNLTRRSLLGSLCLLAWVRSSVACAGSKWLFRVERAGRDIGRHQILLQTHKASLQVTVNIELAVRIAWLRAYYYTHENREHWLAGHLQAFHSKTNDNGRIYTVDCVRDLRGFVIASSEGHYRTGPRAVATTYWHRAFTRVDTWIDSMTGQPRRIICAPQPPRRQDAGFACPGASFSYAVQGDLELQLDYLGDSLAALTFMLDGAAFTYVPLELPATIPHLSI